MRVEVVNISMDRLQALHERLIDESGRIRLLPTSFYRRLNPLLLRAFLNHTGRYQVPTCELIDWLREQIGDRTAIEIGSGNGDLYYHLGIPGTDSGCQQRPEVKAQYAMMRQMPTNPPPDVHRMEALGAIAHFKPQVVIGAWVTQKTLPEDDPGNGSMYGVEEEKVIAQCDYIHIGNNDTHAQKRIISYRCRVLKIYGLVSRAKRPEENRVYVWRKVDA